MSLHGNIPLVSAGNDTQDVASKTWLHEDKIKLTASSVSNSAAQDWSLQYAQFSLHRF